MGIWDNRANHNQYRNQRQKHKKRSACRKRAYVFPIHLPVEIIQYYVQLSYHSNPPSRRLLVYTAARIKKFQNLLCGITCLRHIFCPVLGHARAMPEAAAGQFISYHIPLLLNS